MSKIKILPENLANQIAAGEVVERPASVVKEFLENSIDAGANDIAVQVEGRGDRLIRIIDDGSGMDADDILLSLERHATSKLSSVEQLSSIQTLGFRGEAIPSIASVSRMTITSRLLDKDLGTRVEVRFGKVIKVHEMGCAKGTVMEVRDLFGNVPARKKFLKSAQTELFHTEETVRNYALAHHQLGVAYTVNSRDLFRAPSQTEDLLSRVNRLLFKKAHGVLIPVANPATPDQEPDAAHVSGFLLQPDESPGSGAKLRLFVNGRAVRDRMISHAVAEGMHGFLLKGRRPVGVLFLVLPPTEIDVNVHPTKQEIRFRNSHRVHQRIVHSVRSAMESFQKDWKFSVFGLPEAAGRDRVEGPTGKGEGGELQEPVRAQHKPRRESWIRAVAESGVTTREPSSSEFSGSIPEPDGHPAVPEESDAVKEPGPEPAADQLISGQKTADGTKCLSVEKKETLFPEGIRSIGQLLNAYILCESNDGLVAIDQHAVQERLIYELLMQQFRLKTVARQILLFPHVMECNPKEIRVLEQYEEEIGGLGLDIQEFGGESYVIKAVPAILADIAPDEIMAGIFEQFMDIGGKPRSSAAKRFENVIASMACKAAIKAGQALQSVEIEHLLQQIKEADIFSHCPHGRPVMKFFSADEIKKWFRRT